MIWSVVFDSVEAILPIKHKKMFTESGTEITEQFPSKPLLLASVIASFDSINSEQDADNTSMLTFTKALMLTKLRTNILPGFQEWNQIMERVMKGRI